MMKRLAASTMNTTKSSQSQSFVQQSKRTIVSYMRSSAEHIDKQFLHDQTKQFAKDHNQTFVTPWDLKAGKYKQSALEEHLTIFADQGDVRKYGGIKKFFDENVPPEVSKSSRGITLASCHGATLDHKGASRASELSEHTGQPVTAPLGQLRLNSDKGPVKGEVGEIKHLGGKFDKYGAEQSLSTTHNGKVIRTPEDNPLYRAIKN